jgi:hypothetical protein
MVSDVPAGLCATCTHAHSIASSKGTTFIRCNLSFTDPRFPRYPTLPILTCSGYTPAESRLRTSHEFGGTRCCFSLDVRPEERSMAENQRDRDRTEGGERAGHPDVRDLENDRENDRVSDARDRHDRAEGRDRPPSNRGRDPNDPWLGGG